MNNVLRIKNLSKKYHTKEGEILAIKDINMEVNKGEFIALVILNSSTKFSKKSSHI